MDQEVSRWKISSTELHYMNIFVILLSPAPHVVIEEYFVLKGVAVTAPHPSIHLGNHHSGAKGMTTQTWRKYYQIRSKQYDKEGLVKPTLSTQALCVIGT